MSRSTAIVHLLCSVLLLTFCRVKAQASSGGTVEDDSIVLNCLAKTELAGTPLGESFDDKYVVRNTFTSTEMRTWGFQYCINPITGILSAFRLYLAFEFGQGDYISMTAAGPGMSNCRRMKFSDTLRSVEFHEQDVIVGVTVTVGDKQRSFGNAEENRESTVFKFDENVQAIGVYGNQGTAFINAIGFITYDFSEECRNGGAARNQSDDAAENPTPEPEAETETSPEELPVESEINET